MIAQTRMLLTDRKVKVLTSIDNYDAPKHGYPLATP